MLSVANQSELIFKTYGHETLLFHGASGDTLLLNPTATPILNKLIKSGSLKRETLIDEVATELNFEVDDTFIEHMSLILSELIRRGIVAEQ